MALVSKINLNGETRDIADTTARQSIAAQGTTISQIQTALASKQNTLIAGDGIEIDSTTNVISATGGGGGGSVTVDPALSTTSTNPVQNRVITGALQGLQPALTAGSNIDIDANNIISAIIPTVTIDTEISATSPNAVANYVIARELKTQSDDIAANKALLEQHSIDILGLTDDMADASTDIARNKAAIETLNGDDETTGSVAKQIKDAIGDVDGTIGDLSDLTTTAQDTIVNAINEVDADITKLNANATTVGSVDYKIQQAKLTRVKVVTTVPDVDDAETSTQYWVPNADGTYDIYVKATNDSGDDVMIKSGNTEVDLSDYQTKDLATSVAGEDTVEDALGALETGITNLDASKLEHVTAMPDDPAADDVVLWVGATTSDYTKGMVYQFDGVEAEWKPISAADISVDDELSETSENPVQNKVITEAVYDRLEKVSTMPASPSDGDVVLFVGTTTDDYTKGGIYEYSDTDSEWSQIGSVELSAGNGITITGNTVSADTNIFYGTLDEFNALDDDEKAKYTHISTPESGEYDLPAAKSYDYLMTKADYAAAMQAQTIPADMIVFVVDDETEADTSWHYKTGTAAASGGSITLALESAHDYEFYAWTAYRKWNWSGIHKNGSGNQQLGSYATQFGNLDDSYVLLQDSAVVFINAGTSNTDVILAYRLTTITED